MKKIVSILIISIIFFACKKSNSGDQATYPTVSYTLHTWFENQFFDFSHSSKYKRGTTLFDNWIYWDNGTDGSDVRGKYACEAGNMGTFYQVNLYDTAAQVYDSTTGYYSNTRSILSFTLPSIDNFTNQNDTSVLIYIRDTAY